MKIELDLTEDEARLVEQLLRPQLSGFVSKAHKRDGDTDIKAGAASKLRNLSSFLTKWNYVLVRFRP